MKEGARAREEQYQVIRHRVAQLHPYRSQSAPLHHRPKMQTRQKRGCGDIRGLSAFENFWQSCSDLACDAINSSTKHSFHSKESSFYLLYFNIKS